METDIGDQKGEIRQEARGTGEVKPEGRREDGLEVGEVCRGSGQQEWQVKEGDWGGGNGRYAEPNKQSVKKAKECEDEGESEESGERQLTGDKSQRSKQEKKREKRSVGVLWFSLIEASQSRKRKNPLERERKREREREKMADRPALTLLT